MFTLAHLSDWHATSLDESRVWDFLNKRFLGWLSWRVHRQRVHRPEVLRALLCDVKEQAPDHVAITGDLTNVALESEFVRAAAWLDELGPPDWVSLVPGNHDAYVAVDASRSWDLWSDFMRSDDSDGAAAPRHGDFPTVRIRGEIALVGVCSAHPTGLFQATGRIGPGQLARLEVRLRELGERGLFRVLLVHHPPVDGDLSPRRRLLDSAELRQVVARAGAELVLHGHRHRTVLTRIDGPGGPVPVAGVRSASDAGSTEHRRAQYHLYRIERAGGSWRVALEIRGWDPGSGAVVADGAHSLPV